MGLPRRPDPMNIETDNATPSRPEESNAVGCTLGNLLLLVLFPSAIIGLAWTGWNHWGGLGLVLGILLAIPLVPISIGIVGAIALGLCAVFNRDEYNQIVGKAPLATVEGPIAVPSLRSRQRGTRIRTFLIINAILCVWLGVGIAMVRASKTDRGKESAVMVVVLVPLGCMAHFYATKWVDSRLEKPRAASRREP